MTDELTIDSVYVRLREIHEDLLKVIELLEELNETEKRRFYRFLNIRNRSE